MKRAPRWVWAALALLCLWHLALRRYGMNLPLILDEGEYSYEARVWAAGGLPYRDAASPKPPLIFLAYRLAYAFSDRPEAPRAWFAAFSLLTMALLFASTPTQWSWAARLAPAAAFSTLSTYPAGSLGFAANTELLLAGLMSAAAFAVFRSWKSAKPVAWAWLGGAASGAALMAKPTCLWSVLAFAGLAAWGASSGRGKRLASFTLGVGLIPFLFVAYFAHRGGLATFWEDAFRRNMDYARAAAGAGDWRSQLSWLLTILAPLLIKGGWPYMVLAVSGLGGVPADRRHPVETFVVAWLGTSIAGFMAGFLFFPHYFLQALPALALACGMGVERLAKRSAKRGLALVLFASLWPALVFARIYFVDPPESVAKELLYPNPLYESYPVADYIRTHSSSSDAMYVFGSEPQLYVYAQRAAATEHITVLPLTMYPRPGDAGDELGKLEASPPKFLVYCTQPGSTLVSSRLGAEFRDGVRGLLSRRYRFVGSVVVNPWSEATPRLVAAAGPPDWSSDSSLLLFELR